MERNVYIFNWGYFIMNKYEWKFIVLYEYCIVLKCLCIILVYYFFIFVSKWICMCIKKIRLEISIYLKEISEIIVYKLVKKKFRFVNDYR